MEPHAPYAQDHPAIPLLQAYADEGCPVDCGPDWSVEQVKLLLQRGPHQSAKGKAAIKQLRDETMDKIKHGYARVVTWKEIKENMPSKLKISPVSMIPHKSKAFRCILDLSFNLHQRGKVYHSVNSATNKFSKAESMVQLGYSLQRLIANIAEDWKQSHGQNKWKFAKLDIKDGFWRMAVHDDDAWNFCYVLPSRQKTNSLDEVEIVVPNSLQMGWCESPPLFCSGTETARDIIQSLTEKSTLPPHPLEERMLTEINHDADMTLQDQNEKTVLEVFVDDFIAATNNLSRPHLTKLSRALMHGIHSIFPPPSVTNHNGFDPISEGKLDKGEGTWCYEKEILGWIINGEHGTITLPGKKCRDIVRGIKKILKRKRPSLNSFQKIAGKLQHASFGIPGGSGLFSPIQHAMKDTPEFITLTPLLRQTLADWSYMINFLKDHPTHISKLVEDYPAFIGYSDACGMGAGGIWCSGTKPLSPFVWQYEWPGDIQQSLITDRNPTGTLTINDLELAGIALNWLALESSGVPIEESHIGIFCDNTSAVSWAYKLRTSTSIPAGRLLRLIGLRIHERRSSGLTPLSIAGDKNDMADVASRAFTNGKFYTAAHNLVSYFNKNFPLQNGSWIEFQIPKKIISLVISCLRNEQLPMEWLTKLPGLGRSTGNTGRNTHPSVEHSHSSTIQISPNSNVNSSSAPMLQGSGQVLTEEELRSKFKGSRKRSQPSPRPSNWLENVVPYSKRRTCTK